MTRIATIPVAAFAMLAIACGGGNDSPTAPTPVAPAVPACESNNTASVNFGNRSPSSTYTVIWNGSTAATLGPGQDSSPMTVAAGVAHVMRFQYANTNSLACAQSNPIPARCGAITYTCSF